MELNFLPGQEDILKNFGALMSEFNRDFQDEFPGAPPFFTASGKLQPMYIDTFCLSRSDKPDVRTLTLLEQAPTKKKTQDSKLSLDEWLDECIVLDCLVDEATAMADAERELKSWSLSLPNSKADGRDDRDCAATAAPSGAVDGDLDTPMTRVARELGLFSALAPGLSMDPSATDSFEPPAALADGDRVRERGRSRELCASVSSELSASGSIDLSSAASMTSDLDTRVSSGPESPPPPLRSGSFSCSFLQGALQSAKNRPTEKSSNSACSIGRRTHAQSRSLRRRSSSLSRREDAKKRMNSARERRRQILMNEAYDKLRVALPGKATWSVDRRARRADGANERRGNTPTKLALLHRAVTWIDRLNGLIHGDDRWRSYDEVVQSRKNSKPSAVQSILLSSLHASQARSRPADQNH